MYKIGTLLTKGMIKNKLIIFSSLLIFFYTYIMQNDYIAADVYVEPSDNYVFITQDNPVELKFSALGNKMNSVLFSILNPEVPSEASTVIDLYDEDTAIASIPLSNNDYYEITDSLGSAVEFFAPGGG